MAKLDVVATVTEAYKGAWSHFGDMVKLVWAPVTVYVAASILHANHLQGRIEGIDPEDAEAMMAAIWSWPTVLMILLGLFLWPMIAVAWHRFILLGETSSAALYFRFGRREARFLLTSIFLSLLTVPGILVIAVGGASSASVVTAPLGLIMIAAGIVYALRLSLLLPAVATDGSIDARGILEATEGNVLRIIGAHVLNILALICVAIVVSLIAGISALLVGVFASVVANAVLTVFSQIISVAILSIMYRDLTGGPAASVNPASGPELH